LRISFSFRFSFSLWFSRALLTGSIYSSFFFSGFSESQIGISEWVAKSTIQTCVRV